MFGIVRDGGAMCIIVESWWDCDVEAEHKPGEYSAFDFNWKASLGKLAYPRRFVVRFDEGMDYAAMAKLYRRYADKQGLVKTLEEKIAQMPKLQHYVDNILYRWILWGKGDYSKVKADINEGAPADIRRLQKLGFSITFFFPKWAQGNDWKAFLLEENPVPGGWKTVAKLAEVVHQLGCLVQCFICHRSGPSYYSLDRLKRVLDNVEAKSLKMDAL